MPRRLVKTANFLVIAIIIGLQVSVLITYWYFSFFQKVVAGQGIRETIYYQGKIANTNNVPLASGYYNMQFLIYDAPTNGNVLWTETWDGTNQGSDGGQVYINGGIFAVELNSLCGNWQGGCASNGGVNFNTDALYLEVRFDSDSNDTYEEIFTPRKRLTATPYALNADKIDGLNVGTSGDAIASLAGDNTWSGIQTIQPSDAANKGLIIQGAEGQSANLQEWTTSTGEVLAQLSPLGELQAHSVKTSAITSATAPNGGIPQIISSTKGYWKFDQNSGTNAPDATTGGNDATTSSASWVTGHFGYTGDYALSLTGGGYAQVGDAADLDTYSAFTFEGWIKTASSNTQGLVSKFKNSGTVTDDAYRIELVSGNVRVQLGGGSTSAIVATSSVTVNDDVWHHIAYTFDGTDSALYIDGVYDDAGTYSSFANTLHDSTDDLYIGAVNNNGTIANYFIGTLDNFVLYNEALSANAIQTHYTDSVGSGVAVTLDTEEEFVGSDAKLLSVRNKGEEKAYFANDGTLSLPKLNTTGQSLFALDTDTQALIIKAGEGQTANLLEFQSNAGNILSSVDAEGILNTSGITGRQIISNATHEGTAPTLDAVVHQGYWKFDDADPATTLADETTNGFDGSISSATWNGSGYFGYAGDDSLNFDGSSSYVQVSHDTALNPGDGNFSVEAWVRPTAFGIGSGGYYDTVVAKHDGDFTTGYALIADNGDNVPEFIVGDGTHSAQAVGTTQLALDTWHHLAGVWDASNKIARLYVNGNEVGTQGELNMTTISPTADLIFGRYNRSTQSRYDYFTGDIDTVIISNKVLSAQEALLHYTDGSSVGFTLDTEESFTDAGSKLLSIRNKGSEKIAFDKDGGITSTGQILLTLSSDTPGLTVTAFEDQTSHLQLWNAPGSRLQTIVDSASLFATPQLTTSQILSPQTEEGAAPETETSMSTYWKLDDGTGTSLTDEVGSNDATASGISWAGAGQFGYTGDDAITFDGSTSYVSTPITLAGGANPFSIEFWFKTDDTGVDQDIITQADSSATVKLFRFNVNSLSADELTFELTDTNDTTTALSTPISADTWYHVVGTYDGTTQKLYLNGIERGSVAPANDLKGSQTDPIYFGKYGAGSVSYFDGSLDAVAIYTEAIHPSVVYAHYRDGRAASAHVFDTQNTFSLGKLITVNNNGVERLSIDYSGAITASGLTLQALNGQTGNILEVKDDTGSVVWSVDVDGNATGGSSGPGAVVQNRTAVTSQTYTAATDDYIIEVNHGADSTVNLPTASGIEGQVYVIKNVSPDTYKTIIDPANSETIDGAATYDVLNSKAAMIYSDGANWQLITQY